jgi:hypothetical protein
VIAINDQEIQLSVDQSFGNCPQYIQPREFEWITPLQMAQKGMDQGPIKEFTEFDQVTKELITKSDTFFVASVAINGTGEPSEGADISHRGGLPGFVRFDNKHNLTIPDYRGNSHFNTLGNFVDNPQAGLLFIDFETSNILTLTGTVEVLWDSSEIEYFEGAERLWRFNIKKGRLLNNVLPISWKFNADFTKTLITDS